jgi:hypothetical protein
LPTQVTVVDGSDYTFRWYSKKGGMFYLTEVESAITDLQRDNLVHVFKDFKGVKPGANPLAKGKIGAKDMKCISQTLKAAQDALANGECGCVACEEDRPGAHFVQCQVCEAHYHVECATPSVGADPETWWCGSCADKHGHVDIM